MHRTTNAFMRCLSIHPGNVSLLCQFATWMFHYHLRRFATSTVRCLDDSLPGRFATSLDVSPPDYRLANVLAVSQTDGETSREVAKRPGIETSTGAKRPGGESSRWRTVHAGSEPSKYRIV